jgi:asparagine synthase (glutamine-hydrolysing)
LHAAVASQDVKDFWHSVARLKQLLIRSVEKSQGDSILLSGGLDTSIVAVLASKSNPNLRAFTVVLKDFTSPDLQYSKLISSRLGLGQEIIEATLDDIENSLPEVIRILRSFDPMEIRNSVAVFLGLRKAKSQGYSRVLAGDAADELFAGYSFVANLEKEKALSKLHHLWEVMHFSSISLATSLGIEALLPFLDNEVKKFATTEIPFEFLVSDQRDHSAGEVFGKFILRKAFEDQLPPEIAWRKKTPIEFGSGTTFLPKIYASKIDAQELHEKKRKYLQSDKVRLRDPEQLHYYEIYRRVVGPPAPDLTKRSCPACTSNVPDWTDFCTICGEYPILFPLKSKNA